MNENKLYQKRAAKAARRAHRRARGHYTSRKVRAFKDRVWLRSDLLGGLSDLLGLSPKRQRGSRYGK